MCKSLYSTLSCFTIYINFKLSIPMTSKKTAVKKIYWKNVLQDDAV